MLGTTLDESIFFLVPEAEAVAENGPIMRPAHEAQNSLITVRKRPSSSALASSMFSTTRGRRLGPEPVPSMRRQRALGSKRPPRSRSS